MSFSAHDLRYNAEEAFPLLLHYLNRQAQHSLGPLKFDATERDFVVSHVVEQLVKVGLINGGDVSPHTYIDRMSEAQFNAFLKRSVQNKAIDRLRKRNFQVTVVESEPSNVVGGAREGESNPLDEATQSLWGSMPFQTPEEIIMQAVQNEELRVMLLHCIKELSSAHHQMLAIIHELQEDGALELVDLLLAEFGSALPALDLPLPHESQHKDHAHKKLRQCLQLQNSNLILQVALRLIECKVRDSDSQKFTAAIQTIVQSGLPEKDVLVTLKILAAKGLIDWQDGPVVYFTGAQAKRLAHYYERE